MSDKDAKILELENQLAILTAENTKMRTYLEVQPDSDEDTYPMPADGWVCFHCGQRFLTVGGARFHFGALPTAKPGCIERLDVTDDRGWLLKIRALEEQLACNGTNNV